MKKQLYLFVAVAASFVPIVGVPCPFKVFSDLTKERFEYCINKTHECRVFTVDSAGLTFKHGGELNPTELIEGSLVVMPRSHGGYTVGYITYKDGENVEIIIGRTSTNEALEKRGSVKDVYVVVRVIGSSPWTKFMVTDETSSMCSTYV